MVFVDFRSEAKKNFKFRLDYYSEARKLHQTLLTMARLNVVKLPSLDLFLEQYNAGHFGNPKAFSIGHFVNELDIKLEYPTTLATNIKTAGGENESGSGSGGPKYVWHENPPSNLGM
jgi:hypothetical protein